MADPTRAPQFATPVYIASPPAVVGKNGYQEVPASATTVLGPTGAVGDYLTGLLITPGNTSPGQVQIKDGAGAIITLFDGGAGSVSVLVPFFLPIGARSQLGAWSVITGADVTAFATGSFTA